MNFNDIVNNSQIINESYINSVDDTDNKFILYEIESYKIINKELYDYSYYNISKEEKTIRTNIETLLRYCEYLNLDILYDNLELDKEQIKYHLEFLINKLYYFLYILEKYIETELKNEYNPFKLVLSDIYLSKMIKSYIDNDIYFQDSKKIIFKLTDIIQQSIVIDNLKNIK